MLRPTGNSLEKCVECQRDYTKDNISLIVTFCLFLTYTQPHTHMCVCVCVWYPTPLHEQDVEQGQFLSGV